MVVPVRLVDVVIGAEVDVVVPIVDVVDTGAVVMGPVVEVMGGPSGH